MNDVWGNPSKSANRVPLEVPTVGIIGSSRGVRNPKKPEGRARLLKTLKKLDEQGRKGLLADFPKGA